MARQPALDVRPSHIEAGLADYAVVGTPPAGTAAGSDVDTLVGWWWRRCEKICGR